MKGNHLSRIVGRALAAALASAAVGVTAAAATLVPAATAHAITGKPAASVNQWRLAFVESTTPGSLGEVAATGPGDAWAIGDTLPAEGTDLPYVAHWNGTRWQTVRIAALSGYMLMDVAASSKDNAWILAVNQANTAQQKAFVYNGAHWRPLDLPAGANVGDVEAESHNLVVLGPKDVWVTTASGVTHWNGTTWTPAPIKAGIDAITGTSDGNLWVNGSTFAYHRVNGHWVSVGFSAARGTMWTGVATTSPSDVWIGGMSVRNPNAEYVLHQTTHGWKTITVPPGMSGSPGVITSDGHGGVWPNFQGHYTGSTWILTAIWNAPVQGVSWVNMVKVPGTAGSYWAAIGAGLDGRHNGYPGIFVYGPLP